MRYSMQGIDPKLIGINFAMDHVAPAAPGGWQILIASLDAVCRQPVRRGSGRDGQRHHRRAQHLEHSTPGATGLGGGVVNWTTFYSTACGWGYSGFSESQLEYSIIGGTGTSVSLNNADYADSANFTSGRLTPAIMIAEFRKNSDFIRARALAGGWTAAQIL